MGFNSNQKIENYRIPHFHSHKSGILARRVILIVSLVARTFHVGFLALVALEIFPYYKKGKVIIHMFRRPFEYVYIVLNACTLINERLLNTL